MLKASSVACQRCPALCKKRKSIVDGAGDHSAPLLVVDAWPGREEDKAGMPQLGEGGRLLRATVTEACNRLGVDPLRVFYTYAARCKPGYGHEVSDGELENCLPWLVGEIEELAPICILALGSVAQTQVTAAFLAMPDFGPELGEDYTTVKRAYSPNYILKNKAKLALWSEQIEIAVRRAFSLPIEERSTMNAEPWDMDGGKIAVNSKWLSADTEFDDLADDYGTQMVGWSLSDGEHAAFLESTPLKFDHIYCHNIKADADHLGVDVHDLDSWDDTMLMAYCTRRFQRVGLKVLGPLLAGVEW